jgi:hypothetical protein
MNRLLRALFTARDLFLIGTLLLAATGSYLDDRSGGWMQPIGHWLISTMGTAMLVLGTLAFLWLIGTLALAASASVYLTDSYDQAAKAVLAYPRPIPLAASSEPQHSR